MTTYSQATKKGAVFAGQDNDVIDGRKGENQIFAGDGTNIIRTFKGNDTISSGAGTDFISAGDGNNTVFTGGGGDRVLSGVGKDTIYLGNGKNIVYSGKGNDTIYATGGNNIIDAGEGKDKVFLVGGKNQLILEAGGALTVTGFNTSTDRLRLGESLLGKSLTFTKQGANTLVKSGGETVATLIDLTGTSKLIDNSALFTYNATDLGSFSSDRNGNVNAASINDFGQIVGRFDTDEKFTNQSTATPPVVNPNNAIRQAFIWENGEFKSLTSTGIKNGDSDFGAKNGQTVKLLTPNVNTISNLGTILGTGDEVRQPNPLPTDRALVWEQDSDGYKLTIDDFGGQESYFFDTNNSNQIVGRNILPDGLDKPLISDNGVVTVLASLGGDGGTARGINNQGQIVGFLDTDKLLNDKAVNTAALWEKDAKGEYKLTTLGTFGAEQASLRDINDSGQIIGATSSAEVKAADGTVTKAATSNPFILRDANGDGKYDLSELTQIGSLGGKTGSVNGINEFGQVVGSSADKDGKNRAFLWTEGKIADLNTLISAPITYNGAAVTLTSGASINNFGDITALGTYTYKDTAGKDATGTRSYLLSGKDLAQIVSGSSSNPSPNLSALAAKSLSVMAQPQAASNLTVASATSKPVESVNPLQAVAGTGIGEISKPAMLGAEPSPFAPQPIFAPTSPLLPLPA